MILVITIFAIAMAILMALISVFAKDRADEAKWQIQSTIWMAAAIVLGGIQVAVNTLKP